jgi:hypothetical protein
MIPTERGVEDARDDTSAAAGLTQGVGQYLRLLRAVARRIHTRIQVDVYKTEGGARRSRRYDVDAKRFPLVVA